MKIRNYKSFISIITFLFLTPVWAQNADYQRGLMDGKRAGSVDGRNRGTQEGRDRGQREGYRRGFDRCEAEKKREEYDRGYFDGISRGRTDGDFQGRTQGDSDGESRGRIEGDADGVNRAERQAHLDATPIGEEKGRREANASDASERGRQRGEIEGDEKALSDAKRVDYTRGRQDYRNKKIAEPIENEDEFSQKNILMKESTTTEKSIAMENVKVQAISNSSSDPSADPATEYKKGYDEGYRQSYRMEYDRAYSVEYRQAYDRAERNGCSDARTKSYFQDYERGKNEGYRIGYRERFDFAYRQAYDRAYRDSFSEASRLAYQRTYDRAYDRFFEAARARAYQERFQELFKAAYRIAFDRVYQEKYPVYADIQYQRGWEDETQDFANRPLRFLTAQATETISNGLFEPGEELRVSVQLRNFGNTSISAKEVKLSIQAVQENGSVIHIPAELLVKNIRAKSRTTVNHALSFVLTEEALQKTRNFTVSADYRGVSTGSSQINLTAKFLTEISFAAPPTLKEGIATQWLIKIKNQSSVPVESALNVLLKSNSNMLEITEGKKVVSGLEGNEEKTVSFTVIARTSNPLAQIPFVVESLLAQGRKVGVLSGTKEIPVLNDYKINILSGELGLKIKGVTRLEYSIRNESKRLNPKSLQLLVELIEVNGPVSVVGPNPQYLKPLAPNESLKFIVPLLVEENGVSGMVQLTVKEDGRTVVIHQLKF